MTTIIIHYGDGKQLSLTPEEARELLTELQGVLGSKSPVPAYPEPFYPVPAYQYIPAPSSEPPFRTYPDITCSQRREP